MICMSGYGYELDSVFWLLDRAVNAGTKGYWFNAVEQSASALRLDGASTG